MADEWGPWIEHDGKGCPVKDGVWCHRVFNQPARGTDPTCHGQIDDVSPVESEWESHAWAWSQGCVHIIRYRTLSGPTQKVSVIESLADRQPAKEDA